MAGAERLWADCVSRLRLEFPEGALQTLLTSVSPSTLDQNRFVLTVDSPLYKERIETRFLERVRVLLNEMTGETHDVVVEVGPNRADGPTDGRTSGAAGPTSAGPTSGASPDPRLHPGRPVQGRLDEATPDDPSSSPASLAGTAAPAGTAPRMGGLGSQGYEGPQLKPAFTFDNFVIGESNRFAHAAALAVAEQPAASWNPLFIYGDTGLGKTHLLHAIGHYVTKHYPTYNVRYISTEMFLNEFVDAIRTNGMPTFKRRYRECHVLLVDDIQFIQNKERFQEEFFHTFDSLHSAGHQIVISSDRPPRAIATLEDRLRSRFGGGLITDVQPPELETRLAILIKKAEREPAPVPPEVLDYVATHITDNIRELEGALVRVCAFSSLNRVPITLAVAETVLADVVGQEIRQLTPNLILETTADVFGFSVEDLIGKSRSRPLVQARQISMYVFRELTNFSYPAIGRVFGDRDHTTVMHAVEKISRLIKERRAIFEQVTALMQRLRTGG